VRGRKRIKTGPRKDRDGWIYCEKQLELEVLQVSMMLSCGEMWGRWSRGYPMFIGDCGVIFIGRLPRSFSTLKHF
jgi:hypothetical protein